MITKSNLEKALDLIGYKQDNQTNHLIKHYPEFDCFISVDFEHEKINYPEDKGLLIHKKTTCNFSEPENFVVLECITRLMDKGYRPEHIEIEKTWSLGHDQKSGRADILVKDSSGKTLFIIECKTYDKEYDKALKDTLNDGAQLFSYWQQEKHCKWLILYTSTLDSDKITYKTCAINCSDDKNLIELSKQDSSILLYKNAYTVPELYTVWQETYEKRLLGDILFRDDSIAYQVGVKPLRKKDLIDFSGDDKVVNRFEEILRHNNVSDKENAFNRLVALFICKLVDESRKVDSDVVDFQYKDGTDTYESLQDRLQRLHKEGMEQFMKEDIFYIPEDYAKRTIQQYTGNNRKELIKELDKTLRILKFYTNNDFAFKDVHNEELFLQNGKILVEVVKLFENYRIIGSNNLQMLGDLFEQLLNKGFKQNEGQFFTPVPITHFIWDSLPLEKIIRQDEKVNFPKIIDYACGAGHFLTEGFEAVNDIFIYLDSEMKIDYSWARDNIYGIEKDYRLARVSKISLFMHGAGVGNIIFGDGLENYKEKEIISESFDILVANPPYSVSAFKPHLNLKHNDFTVLDKVSNTGSEIETLFVERISQLLKPKAVAAVILPSSILNKENESFISARESILENFKIRAIVSLSSKTFGATGTNTVVLFLEKFDEPPKKIDLVKDSVESIITGKSLENWEDENIFKEYLKTIDVEIGDYKKFIDKSVNYDEYKNKYFKNYTSSFLGLSSVKTKKKQKTFTKLEKNEQDSILNKMFYDYVFDIEREKIKYFALTYKERTLIINAPNDNKEQEEFLGYKWSNRKGQEGIQITNHGGKLYNNEDRRDENNLASLIRKSFYGEEYSIDDLEEYYYYLTTKDMLDFRSVGFNKGIVIQRKNLKNDYLGSFPIDNLSNIARYVTEKVMYREINPDYYVTTDNMLKDKRGVALYDKIPNVNKVTRYYENDILVSNIRPYLKKIWLADHQGGCSNDILVFRILDNNRILPEYLYEIMKDDAFFDFIMSTAKGIKMPRGDKEKISDYLVPIPSIQQQKIIIDEFKKVDNKINEEKELLEQYDKDIKSKFVEMFEGKNFESKKLSDLFSFQLGKTPSRYNNEYWNKIGYKWISVADMGNYDRFTSDTSEFITDKAIIDTGIKHVPAGTVIMSFKLTIGRTAITSENIYTNEAIIAFLNRGKNYVDNDYLRLYLSIHDWSSGELNAIKGATLNQSSIGNTVIKIPPKDLQDEFASYVEDIDKLKFEANERKKKAEIEKENLIDKYFR
ncbi:N-6 DNA methylase [Veillonella montpellierensis]|uniref:N-6 DNA methylase n=1 Tax=Veillonella montpellierensis TaxID=187328 RepID=UPI0023F62AB1|nr:N-6 DNA methylase [Veillonella montpellierensis]